MDTFRIETLYNKQDFIRGQLIRWKIHWMENRRLIIYLSIASIMILIIGVLARTEEDPTNIFLFIGFVFSFLTLFLIFIRFFSKRRFTREIKEMAEKFDLGKMDCIFEFSDEAIKYWDKEKSLEFKWSIFTSYSIYKDYLILFLNNSLIESYIFEKKESDIDDYNKILEITKSKLDYKEV